MLRSLLAGVIITSFVSGCSGSNELNCEPTARYAGAISIAPVRIPDDLNPPDESDSLRVPPPIDFPADADAARACLESPPDYFDDRPVRASVESAPRERRRARNRDRDADRVNGD